MKQKIALAGVPNCGKTTFWNNVTGKRGKIGNWAGVTTEKLSASIKLFPDAELTDIPGMYSLNPHSLEEIAAKDYLLSGKIDSLIIIIDGTKPEQSIYLALELLSLGIPSVIGINFSDELEKQGIEVNTDQLSKYFGAPVFLISAKNNRGISEILNCAKNLCGSKIKNPVYISPADCRKKAAELSEKCFSKNTKFKNPPYVSVVFSSLFIAVLILLSGVVQPVLKNALSSFFEFLTYASCSVLSHYHAPEIINSFLSEGLFIGLQSLLSFLPELFLIFLVLSYLEESGFMAEFAFASDFVLKKFGLSGRSIIPLLLGFGCTVSGTCAAKTSDCIKCSKRTLSALMFIPCSARLPLVLLFCNVLFSNAYVPVFVFFYIFLILFGAAFHLLTKQKADCRFMLEIPKLRSPSFFVIFKTSFRRLFSFLSKAGATIVLTSVLIWFLGNFSPDLKIVSLQSESILYRLGYHIAPLFSPIGIPFEGAVSLFCGLFSKESSLSAMVSLCPDIRSSFSVLSGISFLLFYLIYSPCLAATAAIAKEYGIKTAVWLFSRQLFIAYSVSFVFYQISMLIANLLIQ